jgi:hypothetical protein
MLSDRLSRTSLQPVSLEREASQRTKEKSVQKFKKEPDRADIARDDRLPK